ncbi:MAG: hypothetical protein KF841_02665 [Phycisphaerae bacterium]|nr:hypothetical protein [Phycisphaerae bacterium]
MPAARARRIFCVVALFTMTGALGSAGWADDNQTDSRSAPPTTQAVVGSSATTTTKPSDDAQVRRLVSQLGAADFKMRQAAQHELERLGERAMPVLVEFVGDANSEIANRVGSLIRRPRDATLRVETAAKLLATADPDWMEKGVYMVFETPVSDCELLAAKLDQSRGRDRAILMPVVAQLRMWRSMVVRFEERQARLLDENRTAVADKERRLHEESMYYQAEAAYWMAVDASEEYSDASGQVSESTTQPATSRPVEGK